MTNIAAVILAAGRASRFQSCKMLAPVNDTPLISFPIKAALSVTPHVFVVTGYWHETLSEAKERYNWPVTLLHEDTWDEGIGSVIAKVTKQLSSQYDALLFMLADQPAVSADNVALLWKVFSEHSVDAVCCQYRDSVGVPAIAGKSMFGALQRLSGDSGAKHLLSDERYKITAVDIDQCNIDIDTPADLECYVHYINNMASLW
ncbi:nucleotidyltransferase family protein [Enterovibrio paralichthyis]|uniref:nucleotidyltransferase family protein n=1 Tax=Enterovibrio paralichthyis TaxID=2853805 RepID=UPI001C45121E|nr:nucleotidyltransferase family protein [Enterovibrio paralichthyis]MBV7296524.1 nucleotidyltransferase family protein [Enterovibrio paralichthyis]